MLAKTLLFCPDLWQNSVPIAWLQILYLIPGNSLFLPDSFVEPLMAQNIDDTAAVSVKNLSPMLHFTPAIVNGNVIFVL